MRRQIIFLLIVCLIALLGAFFSSCRKLPEQGTLYECQIHNMSKLNLFYMRIDGEDVGWKNIIQFSFVRRNGRNLTMEAKSSYQGKLNLWYVNIKATKLIDNSVKEYVAETATHELKYVIK